MVYGFMMALLLCGLIFVWDFTVVVGSSEAGLLCGGHGNSGL